MQAVVKTSDKPLVDIEPVPELIIGSVMCINIWHVIAFGLNCFFF